MTQTIQVMSSNLANQIAAGEVIERPASVVKELVENAIDAGSTRIEVTVEEAGLEKIRVVDDGEGIPFDEVLFAFERHATSKLLSDEDLFRIRTLGFRGEALPSIASVSKVVLESAQANQSGKRVELEGGTVTVNQSAKARKGTDIIVSELFFNTPARLKYIKTLKTELSHISDTINRFALAHPEISFKLVSDDSTVIKTVGNDKQIQAIAGVYGVETARKMRAISGQSFDYEVRGFISLPELTRASNSYITLIINGRVIKNFALNRSIVDGYGSTLMVGRYPVAVISITVDPKLLDVNVHPTKQQVRISNERDLGQLISDTIKEVLSKERRIPNAVENIYDSASKKLHSERNTSQQTQFKLEQSSASKTNGTKWNNEQMETTDVIKEREKPTYSGWKSESPQQNDIIEEQTPLSHQEPILKTALRNSREETVISGFPDLDYIGQMHGTYLFAQNDEGLFIIDQHAAQERIKYEYFKERIGEEGTDLQELLVPIVLDYPSDEAMIIKENKEILKTAGLNLEEFGQNSFLVRNHPSWMETGQIEDTVKEMIAFFIEKSSLSVAKFREAAAIMMSCKRSIKANHYLSRQEAVQLLTDLKECHNPYNCPHGRPVLVNFSTKDMEKMFKRIQDPH
ncbi:MAG: DNA mismatch repair endonuclease MutL [Alkalibacterium sp.]|nr:DNA mismatch repair endonuclease MutL [Alkalibacterium sp.]TVP92308.1 MAG: DNA mismatch repair endonuclease MutL [Alkalibacterium sp.]